MQLVDERRGLQPLELDDRQYCQRVDCQYRIWMSEVGIGRATMRK